LKKRNKELSMQEIKQRYYNVGGVPRHIFASPSGYKQALLYQEDALNQLSADQAISFVCNRTNGVVTKEADQPKSSLVALTSSQETDFTMYTASPVSTNVMSKIFDKFLVSIWGQIITGQAPEFLFEQYTMNFLSARERILRARKCTGYSEKEEVDGNGAVDENGSLNEIGAGGKKGAVSKKGAGGKIGAVSKQWARKVQGARKVQS
jgi:Retrotransposon hot spot protein